jgi:hypothetical protein
LTNLEIFVSVIGLFSGYFIVSKLLDVYSSESLEDNDKYLPRNRQPGDDKVEEPVEEIKEGGYLVKHWHGEHSLSKSFWVNNVIFNIILVSVITYWVFAGTTTEDPVYLSRVILGISIFGYVILYPWQIIGLWRSANKQINITSRTFWPRTVKFLVILGVLGSIVDLVKENQFYKDLYYDSFILTKEKNYDVRLIDETIVLDGGFDYGISDRVKELLRENRNIDRIVLNSNGGLLYEANIISKLILTNSLNTYSQSGCYSACTIAYVSGSRRYVARDARLGFHQYSYYRPQSEFTKLDLFDSQEDDARFFRKRGVSKEFTDKMYQSEPEDMWYPSNKELVKFGLVHEIID